MNNFGIISYFQAEYAQSSAVAVEALCLFFELADLADMAESIRYIAS